MTAYLSKVVADEVLLTSIEERAALGSIQSRRIYNPVRAGKVEKEPGHVSLIELVAEELHAAVEQPWPSSISEEHRAALSKVMQPARRAPDELVQAIEDSVATQSRVLA